MADLRFEVDGGIALITLDRPDRLNAFTGAMAAAWGEAYLACDLDDAVRVVVVTGAGRAFCAGADLSDLGSGGGGPFASPGPGAFSASPVQPPAWAVRKPVIAAVNGHAIGIGLSLAMQCDLRLVSHDAKLAFAHVRRGVMPDAGAHWTVVHAVGLARAASVLLTGRTFSGMEAAAIGLATSAHAAPDVLPAALDLARDIVTNVAPVSAAVSKRAMWSAAGAPSPEVIEALESDLHRLVMGAPDAAEGGRAFLQKRAPVWAGRPSDLPPWPG